MANSDFIPGQRWISDTEPELGLGIVESVELRTLAIVFPANNERRTYSREDAPLTRVRFSQHDVIENTEKQKLTIHEIIEQAGLLCYIGENEKGETLQFEEIDLNAAMKLNKPKDRLFNAQLDKNSAYTLRYETLQRLNTLLPASIRGLCGPRVSLVPHQFFIAHEVSQRSSPRVLLADEVGLGKTIEAGLILHQQLILGRAQRVLILVPETLQHQWLVEMLRRFNLHFSIYHEQRCASLDEEMDNPFLAEQLVLCSIDFLAQSEKRRAQVQSGQWDMLIVDEAHHLQWQPGKSSIEYDMVENLSQVIDSVLLLTATPEQLGAAGHFARLRLLDPDRFFDFEEFLQEESLYEPVANAVDTLQRLKPLNEHDIKALQLALTNSEEGQSLLIELSNPEYTDRSIISEQLINLLRDRHGTGRILFRNTRNTIKGFPQRQLCEFPLTAADEYIQPIIHATANADLHPDTASFALTPERIYQTYKAKTSVEWTEIDPRVNWMYQQLKSLGKHKVLVICASANTVLELEQVLRTRYGLHAAVFHEAMSIVERDRAAAYFADQDEGSQVLICSEIGSEGRNFQFSHHLFLFDLPLNPDLLEQRIGRLDRIGQKHTIKIMVPYIKDSAQEVMLQWYHHGINAFEQTCPAGLSVYNEVENSLLSLLQNPVLDTNKKSTLIQRTQEIFASITQRLQQGRDRLLELNSFRDKEAQQIIHSVMDADSNNELLDYIGRVFDTYGLDFESRDSSSYVVRPSDHMLVHHFPGVPAEGMTFTTQRQHALIHENQHYITWEHPLVSGAMDLILSNEQGNSTLIVSKLSGLKAGDILLECIFRIQGTAPHQLQIDRFLPPCSIRVLIDQKLDIQTGKIAFDKITALPVELDAYTVRQIIDSQQHHLRKMLDTAEQHTRTQLPKMIKQQIINMNQTLQLEINRLKELQKINPNVRNEEIEFIKIQKQQLAEYMAETTHRLDALRLIIAA